MSKKKWWRRKKKKEEESVGYTPMGNTLTWDVAMVQAVTALDHAASLSISDKSPQGMREVAIGWLAVASTLEDAKPDPDEMDLEESSDNYPIGFRGAAPVEDDEEEGD